MTFGKSAFIAYQTLMQKHFGQDPILWADLCEVEQGVWESVAMHCVGVGKRTAERKAHNKFVRRWK